MLLFFLVIPSLSILGFHPVGPCYAGSSLLPFSYGGRSHMFREQGLLLQCYSHVEKVALTCDNTGRRGICRRRVGAPEVGTESWA